MDPEFYRRYPLYEQSHWWFRGRRRIIDAILKRSLGPFGPCLRLILDAGCGRGSMFPVLRQFGFPIGVEESWEALRDPDGQMFGKTVQGSVEALPFSDRTFYLVTALDVLEHLENDAAALNEFNRLCTDDGFLLLTVPAFRFLWGPQDEISHHRRRYTAKDLGNMVEASGFSVVRLTYFNTFLFPFIALVRLSTPVLLAVSKKCSAARPFSDFDYLPCGPINRFLGFLFGVEGALISRWSMPFGVSLLCLARKTRASKPSR